MIIFGRKASHLASEKINGICSSCGQENTLHMVLIQKYAHIFWIPFIPTGRTAATQCEHCKHVMEKKEFSEDLTQSYSVLSQKKVPLWTFSGVFVLVGLMFLLRLSGSYFDNRKADRLASPMPGDIYSVKLDDDSYTLMKVQNIVDDTLYFLLSEYEANMFTGLRKIKKKGDEAYGTDAFPILKEDIHLLYKEGKVFDIDRE